MERVAVTSYVEKLFLLIGKKADAQAAAFSYGGIMFAIEIDASDLADDIQALRDAMTETQFENAMYGIYRRTSRHVSKILKDDLPKQYKVPKGDIGRAVKAPRIMGGGGAVGCIIPITAPRRNIGTGFTAAGGAHGWKTLRMRKRYKVKARIVTAGQSTLPDSMKSYAGYPPFRNLGSKLGKLTFTRAGKKRFPILKVSGIAIPQMPMNRSETDVQEDIKEYLEKQIEQRFMALMRIGK